MRLTAQQATRRYVGLTALRWLPVGLVVPVTVLLATSRGLSPAEVGLAFTAHGLVVVVLELPTGGLADAVGRRPVLLLSGAFNLAGLSALVLAQDVLGFALAYGLVGVGRALDSGALEAWFVDALHAADPRADPARGLSLAGVADGAALSVGALASAGLPRLAGDSLTVPYVAACALTAVSLLAVALLVTPAGLRPPQSGLLAALRDGVVATPGVMVRSLRLAHADRALRLLVLTAFGGGVVVVTVELIAPLRYAAVQGGTAEGSAAYALVVAVGFGAAALGSSLAGPVRRLAGDSISRSTAGLSLLAAVALLGLGLGTSAAALGVGVLGFYLFNGAAWPLRKALLHTRVEAGERASTVSLGSLALQLGGIGANTAAPVLYGLGGARLAFGGAALVLVALALVSLRLPAPVAVA